MILWWGEARFLLLVGRFSPSAMIWTSGLQLELLGIGDRGYSRLWVIDESSMAELATLPTQSSASAMSWPPAVIDAD